MSVESRCSSPIPFDAVPAVGATANRGYSSSSGSSVDVDGALAHMLSSRPLLPSSPGKAFLKRADSIQNAMYVQSVNMNGRIWCKHEHAREKPTKEKRECHHKPKHSLNVPAFEVPTYGALPFLQRV